MQYQFSPILQKQFRSKLVLLIKIYHFRDGTFQFLKCVQLESNTVSELLFFLFTFEQLLSNTIYFVHTIITWVIFLLTMRDASYLARYYVQFRESGIMYTDIFW